MRPRGWPGCQRRELRLRVLAGGEGAPACLVWLVLGRGGGLVLGAPLRGALTGLHARAYSALYTNRPLPFLERFPFDFLELMLSPEKKAPLTLVVWGRSEDANECGLKLMRSDSSWRGEGTTHAGFLEGACFETGLISSIEFLVGALWLCWWDPQLSCEGE